MGAYAQAVYTVPAGGRSLSLTTFDRRLTAGTTSCDLSEMRFIDAYGLVGTACALLAAASAGTRPPIKYPDQSQVCEHLARIGFGELLRQLDYPMVLPETMPIARPDVLVPLTRIDRVFGAERLSHLVHEQLRDLARVVRADVSPEQQVADRKTVVHGIEQVTDLGLLPHERSLDIGQSDLSDVDVLEQLRQRVTDAFIGSTRAPYHLAKSYAFPATSARGRLNGGAHRHRFECGVRPETGPTRETLPPPAPLIIENCQATGGQDA